uniref:Olfactory receptor 69 n=1 Tax=Adelphocoris lineolatus TaxID=236346 RepID=A0A2I4PH66_ADELI|nr:olfactory receptor 69 [Adelphocoris lineolatus]
MKEEKEDNSSGCTDYRKYIFCRLMCIDDRLVDRGLTWPLLLIMAQTVAMETCSFVSIFKSTEIKNGMDCVRSFLLGNLVTMVLFNEFTHRRRLARLHEFLEKSMSTLRTGLPEEEEILKNARDQASSNLKMYMMVFFGNIAPMVFAQPLGEWLSGHSWKRLPIPWSFPPSDTDWAFIFIFLFQFVGVVMANCLGMVFMSFSSITIQVTALFDVLLLSLRHMEMRAKLKGQIEYLDYHQSLYSCLRDDVIFYEQLVRELESITPHLRNTFLAFSATVPMIMACEAYPIMLGNFAIADLIKSFVFLAIQFMCWAQTCMKLETMTDQHVAVFRTLYDTPWYEAGVRFKKLIFMSLTYASPPKYIKARMSNEITATTATFYSFVVSSFNWLNLIRKMS